MEPSSINTNNNRCVTPFVGCDLPHACSKKREGMDFENAKFSSQIRVLL
jgi:hypothetical protein